MNTTTIDTRGIITTQRDVVDRMTSYPRHGTAWVRTGT